MIDTRVPEASARLADTVEGRRLVDDPGAWQRWGPYLAERQWGTVREDYSAHGDAWSSFPHDHARSRAYRWGEDGIAGFSDDKQRWCLALGLWNGRDPILKERMFGLTNAEGNHGEDVKELWWYLDGTPTHSLMRMLYKYPHVAFPYDDLVAQNGRRGHDRPEYELIDTGLFDEGRYCDVAVDYAKDAPDDILMRVTVTNRGPDAADLHVLPHVWARNIWSWDEGAPRPLLRLEGGAVSATRIDDAPRRFEALQAADFLFCENETNVARLYGGANAGPVKDGINDCIVHGDRTAVSARGEGTKCAAVTMLSLGAGEARVLRFRFARADAARLDAAGFDRVLADRIAEADAWYAALQHDLADPDARMVQRQAIAGMLWSKQYYLFDVRRWLAGDPTEPPPPPERRHGRDAGWLHLYNDDVIAMPDAWEYPWYAGWDLAFHAVTYAPIDPAFAKRQLLLLTDDGYMAPNGQLPAYEWDFGDVNPPVQAWAAWRIYRIERDATGAGDRGFLQRMLHKLMLNFTWWVNREDADGCNIFQGGFLGLDNIGVFDRSKPLPTGGHLSQADATAWMAMMALDLMRIALELAEGDPAYEDIATKFFDHFLLIAEAINAMGDDTMPTGLWDGQDRFYYDMLDLPDGTRVPLRVRSLVGLIPLCAVEVLEGAAVARLPGFARRLAWTLAHRPELAALVSRWGEEGKDGRMLLSLLRRQRMAAVLSRMLDETEFLSDHGIRSLSKAHQAAPYVLGYAGGSVSVDYEPGESTSGMFGGNSNWRGPVWMPLNVLLIEALGEFDAFYGADFTIECPTGSGREMPLRDVAAELARRLSRLFLRDAAGRRPVLGDNALLQADPHFRDHVPFHEYFHGDTGAGLGAAHQTGWTGLIALLLQRFAAQ